MAHGIFVAALQGLSLQHVGSSLQCIGFCLVVARGLSSCDVQAPECTGSVVVAHGLRCPVACGILVPLPGIKPASSALEGGFLTTGPPGKSPKLCSCNREKNRIQVLP